MKNNVTIFIVIALIVILGIVFFLMESGEKTTTDNRQPGDTKTKGVVAAANVIGITSNGFSPKVLSVKAGDVVTFVNKDSSGHWPASAMHPTHTVYPRSDIKKCGTPEEKSIFDSCGSLSNREEYKFTFNEKGSWKYHDHLSPGSTGTINVN